MWRGLPQYFYAVVRLKQSELLSNKQSRKAYYSYLTPGAVARSVACKLRKQVLRSILAFGTLNYATKSTLAECVKGFAWDAFWSF